MRAQVAVKRSGPQGFRSGLISAMPGDLNRADWVEVHAGIAISRSPEVVFCFVCDPQNDARWLAHVGKVEQLTPGPIGIGTRFRQFPIFLGSPVEVEWEVIDFVPNRHMQGCSVAGPIRFARRYDLQPVGSATRITKTVKFDLSFVAPFM